MENQARLDCVAALVEMYNLQWKFARKISARFNIRSTMISREAPFKMVREPSRLSSIHELESRCHHCVHAANCNFFLSV